MSDLNTKNLMITLLFSLLFACTPNQSLDENGSSQVNRLKKSWFNLVTEPIATCVDVLPENVSKGETYMKCDGSTAVGTLDNSTATVTACTSDGQQNCLSTSTLKSVNTATISASDIKVGKTVAGIAGTFVPGSTLNVCKNGQSNATYNNSGLPGTGASNAAGGANQYDWWDSVDEYGNMTYPAAFSGVGAAWGSESFCNGSTFSNVTSTQSWLTPTTGVNCLATTCTAANAFNKIMYDSLTGFYVTNVLVESSTGATNPCVGAGQCANMNEALSICDNIDSGDGTGKWRIPTIKELSALYISGIFGLNASQFGDLLDDIFWSATRDSADPLNSIHTLRLHTGEQYAYFPTSLQAVMCMRN